jgi:Lipase (class 3)
MPPRIGRSLDAVLNPKHYPPFAGITTAETFDRAWQENPMGILANMAHAAYCAPVDMAQRFSDFGAATRFYESRPDGDPVIRGRQAFLAIWADKAILAFRGTEGSEKLRLKTPDALRSVATKIGWDLPEALDTFLCTDILDDLNFMTTPYQRSRVHKGFLEATLELWPSIDNDLATLCAPSNRPVFVTGHSLGGAMAVIAGMTYAFKRIVTFGEPCVGQDIHHTIPDPAVHIRYVNGNDPVPRIVPTFYPFRYRHHGELHAIVDQKYGGPNALYDHAIVNYAEILRETIPS